MATTMQSAERQLIFIPGPGMGHIVAAVEVAKLILNRESRLSITFLLIKDSQVDQYIHSLQISANQRLRFINLPEVELEPGSSTKLPPLLASQHINRHKPLVREALLAITKSEETRVAGFIIDMFCINMIDVANDFKIPSYLFFTSSSAFLSMWLFFQSLTDDHGEDITEFKNSDKEFLIPGFVNPVPAKVMPSMMLDKNGGSELVVSSARRIRETRGVFINTFQELESTAIKDLSDSSGKIPPIYPIGPIINLNTESENPDSIISWLDKQPSSSVLFLCFGSQGSFIEAQIKHLATALESSGRRFLWSLRWRKPDKKAAETTDSTSPDEILPKGFLKRTSGIGKVIGWASQVAVLAHPAIGGFVSHCGWNSILESLWFGVPTAAWPLAAEQQANAFQMVVEMGMAIEIKMDYRNDINDEIVVGAGEIERAIDRLMADEDADGMKKKVKDMREKSSRALMEGGSSYRFLGCLIHDIMHNTMPQGS
ncbi:UDP-glucuronosyl and UDP-glucosyl transferase [Handroanthus impetiginosus]|uniref:Glycosyltransferase n=1 Tax=Handroanthus impetiginosus TaxID=429701 RepID=A0A2G9HXD7_9LAMI|nr:UDP-glucuronosyl and UDP-glucosyl transferase [Handroanthus impetiginosus]